MSIATYTKGKDCIIASQQTAKEATNGPRTYFAILNDTSPSPINVLSATILHQRKDYISSMFVFTLMNCHTSVENAPQASSIVCKDIAMNSRTSAALLVINYGT